MSYPQPSPSGAFPDWKIQSDASIDTVSCSHVIFSRALGMLQHENEATPAVLALLEELMPLLSLEDGLCEIEAQDERVREYLTLLAEALESSIRQESGVGTEMATEVPNVHDATIPILGCLSVHLLPLLLRCGAVLYCCDLGITENL